MNEKINLKRKSDSLAKIKHRKDSISGKLIKKEIVIDTLKKVK